LGLEVDIDRRHDYRIKADDPLSAAAYFTWKRKYTRGSWGVWSETRLKVSSTAADFLIEANLDAYEGDRKAHTQNWNLKVPRKLV
jgi:hypothetical protein